MGHNPEPKQFRAKDHIVYKSKDSLYMPILAGAFFLLILLPVTLTGRYDLAGRVAVAVILCVLEVTFARAAIAAVLVFRDEVVIRNVIRTRRVPWRDIAEFKMLPGFAGRLVQTDGSRLSLEGLGVIRVGRKRAVRRNTPIFCSLNRLLEIAKSGDMAALEAMIATGGDVG